MINQLIDKVGRKLVGNSLWLFIEKVLRLVVGLFIGVLVARYLGPEQMGLWNYCLAIFTFFIIFPSLGLEYVGPREFVNRLGEAEKLLNTAVRLKLIGATTGIVLSVLLMGLFKGFSSDILPYILILTTGYLFQAFDVIDHYYQSRLEQKKTVIVRIIAFLLISGYKFYLLQIGAPLIYFVASSTIEFFIGAIGLLYSFRQSEIALRLNAFDWTIAKSLLKDSLVFSVTALVVVIYFKIDQIMITEMLGEKENGIYSIAIRMYEMFAMIPAVIGVSYLTVLTKAYGQDEAEFRSSLKKFYTIITYLAIFSTIGIWIFGPWVMALLYGADYEGSGAILQLVSIGMYFAFMGIGTGNYLVVRNLKAFILTKSIIGLVVNVVLNLWLIPLFGITGAAIASIVSNFISTFLILGIQDNHRHLDLILTPFRLSTIRRFLTK